MSAVPLIIGGIGALSGLASIPYMLGYGQPSEEDQERMLRRQLEIQDEFEQRRAGGGGAGDAGVDPELAGLLQQRPQNMTGLLMGENALFKQVEEASYKLKKARNRRPQYMDELGDIVAGQHARIAALQGERTPSALEIIQMMEEMGG